MTRLTPGNVPDSLAKRENKLLESICVLQQDFLKRGIYYGWCRNTLDNLICLTESRIGFICGLSHKEDGTPFIISHSISNIAWNEETRQFYEAHCRTGLEFFNFDSIWGSVFATGQAVISNDPDNDFRRGGYPRENGHPQLTSFLGLPIKDSMCKIVGIMGVANRPNGYDQDLVDFLAPFLVSYGLLLEKDELDKENRKLEEERSKLIIDLNRSLKETGELVKQLNQAQQMAKLGHWDYNLESNTLYWSDQIYRMFGLKPQVFRATYEAFIEAVHPDDRDHVNRAYIESIENKTPYDIEHRIVLKNGDQKWVREICTTEYSEEGKPLRSIGTVHDITDKKIASEERERLLKDIEETLAEVRTLRGILPICSFCKKIRNDEGYYEQLEAYIHKHSGVDFSHTICPDCMKKYYPEEYKALCLKPSNSKKP